MKGWYKPHYGVRKQGRGSAGRGSEGWGGGCSVGLQGSGSAGAWEQRVGSAGCGSSGSWVLQAGRMKVSFFYLGGLKRFAAAQVIMSSEMHKHIRAIY